MNNEKYIIKPTPPPPPPPDYTSFNRKDSAGILAIIGLIWTVYLLIWCVYVY